MLEDTRDQEPVQLKELFRRGYLEQNDTGEVCLTTKGLYELKDVWDFNTAETGKPAYREEVLPANTLTASELVMLFKNDFVDYDKKTGRIYITRCGANFAYEAEKNLHNFMKRMVEKERQKLKKKLDFLFVSLATASALLYAAVLLFVIIA